MHEYYNKAVINQSSSSAGYFVGFIGAAVYFIQHAVGFWAGVLGFLKACVWPAFVVYYILEYLKL
ncbi:MAG: hypothetical protein IPH78_14305 [Bacteroidetes bacterium]|nr:hypothetical protein [Bacteroidota bacterium]